MTIALSRLEKVHNETLGVTVDRQNALRDAKGLMTDRNFEGEFHHAPQHCPSFG